uniref:Uncharacterized protein n=1 Tax=Rhizophora mucronata TaxID=61149 RepID=A0A2P2QW02_RHIMU
MDQIYVEIQLKIHFEKKKIWTNTISTSKLCSATLINYIHPCHDHMMFQKWPMTLLQNCGPFDILC